MALMAPKVSDFLGPEQVRALGRKSNLVGALLVAHAWALIAAAWRCSPGGPIPSPFSLA